LFVTASVFACVMAGCESAPAVRNIDAVYRFENLRTETRPGEGRPARDEWREIRPILERASAKKIDVSRSGVRTYGSLEFANYECRCVLRSLGDVVRVQSELDALRAGEGGRVETYLAQLTATYKSNFVLATVSVGVSGATVAGNRVRIFALPWEPPVETTASSTGIWTAHVSVVPESTWIYGVSEDPNGKMPAEYFRINVSTRKLERVEESEFLRMFPPGGPGKASGSAPREEGPAPSSASSEEQKLQERRRREDEEFRRRHQADDRKHGAAGSP
jgi:hypothetical protein